MKSLFAFGMMESAAALALAINTLIYCLIIIHLCLSVTSDHHFTDSAFTCVRKNSLSMASHDHEVALTQLFTSIHSSTHFITKNC